MLDSENTDLAMLHAQNQAMEVLAKFFHAYYLSRLPTPEDIAQQLQLPLDMVMMAMSQEEVEV